MPTHYEGTIWSDATHTLANIYTSHKSFLLLRTASMLSHTFHVQYLRCTFASNVWKEISLTMALVWVILHYSVFGCFYCAVRRYCATEIIQELPEGYLFIVPYVSRHEMSAHTSRSRMVRIDVTTVDVCRLSLLRFSSRLYYTGCSHLQSDGN